MRLLPLVFVVAVVAACSDHPLRTPVRGAGGAGTSGGEAGSGGPVEGKDAGGGPPNGACEPLGECACYEARDRCELVSESCWCPSVCNPSIACICGGGKFVRCKDRAR
jgi:hypothetical protein